MKQSYIIRKYYYLSFSLQKYPEHTKALLLMGDINVNVLKKLDDAENNFARVVELEPDNVQAHHNLCVVHVERGDLIRAEKCLSKVGDIPQPIFRSEFRPFPSWPKENNFNVVILKGAGRYFHKKKKFNVVILKGAGRYFHICCIIC